MAEFVFGAGEGGEKWGEWRERLREIFPDGEASLERAVETWLRGLFREERPFMQTVDWPRGGVEYRQGKTQKFSAGEVVIGAEERGKTREVVVVFYPKRVEKTERGEVPLSDSRWRAEVRVGAVGERVRGTVFVPPEEWKKGERWDEVVDVLLALLWRLKGYEGVEVVAQPVSVFVNPLVLRLMWGPEGRERWYEASSLVDFDFLRELDELAWEGVRFWVGVPREAGVIKNLRAVIERLEKKGARIVKTPEEDWRRWWWFNHRNPPIKERPLLRGKRLVYPEAVLEIDVRGGMGDSRRQRRRRGWGFSPPAGRS